ncbi:MAG: hypothetical protein QUS12_11155, partial [Methanosarcina sp.]|nr:hypothetical protein [Methanosarcina sp.]
VRSEEQATLIAEKLETLLNDKELLVAEMEESQEQLRSIQQAFSTRQEERARLENMLHQERRKLVETETRQVQLKAHLRELQGRIETQNSSRVNLIEGIEKVKADILDAQKGLEHLNVSRKQAEEKVAEIEAEVASTVKNITESEEKIKQVNSEIGKLDAELARNQAQLEVLEQAERAFSGMGEGAKSLLIAARNGRLKGQMQSISQLLEVPAEYEVAISSVLGEQLDAVLYGDESDAESILQFLETDNAGRAILIPSTRTRQSEILHHIKNSDVIGIASDLVKGINNNKELVHFLLGGVLVANDRSTARNLIRELPSWAKIVTLKGEVFNANGVIIAGKERRSGIISRPRQKKDLEESTTALQQKKVRLVEELEALNGQLKKHQEKR